MLEQIVFYIVLIGAGIPVVLFGLFLLFLKFLDDALLPIRMKLKEWFPWYKNWYEWISGERNEKRRV